MSSSEWGRGHLVYRGPGRILRFWVSAAGPQRCGVNPKWGLRGEGFLSNSCSPSPSKFGVAPQRGSRAKTPHPKREFVKFRSELRGGNPPPPPAASGILSLSGGWAVY